MGIDGRASWLQGQETRHATAGGALTCVNAFLAVGHVGAAGVQKRKHCQNAITLECPETRRIGAFCHLP